MSDKSGFAKTEIRKSDKISLKQRKILTETKKSTTIQTEQKSSFRKRRDGEGDAPSVQ